MTRPRVQLHLSTLLILTVVAAGLVWLNVNPHGMGHDIPIFRREGGHKTFSYGLTRVMFTAIGGTGAL
jgi:hypothetical protein